MLHRVLAPVHESAGCGTSRNCWRPSTFTQLRQWTSGGSPPQSGMEALNVLKQAKIIPDVIPSDSDLKPTGVPSVAMSIRYQRHAVVGGNELTPQDAHAPPTIEFDPPPPNGYSYVLVLTDPDAPFPESPKAREWCHWIASRILGTTLRKEAEELMPYAGPSPPAGSAAHRYVFLLFLAPLKWTPVKVPSPNNRKNFHAMEWAHANGLQLVSASHFITRPR